MLGLAAGRQIVLRTAPSSGVSADYRARPAARIGGGSGAGQPVAGLPGDIALRTRITSGLERPSASRRAR